MTTKTHVKVSIELRSTANQEWVGHDFRTTGTPGRIPTKDTFLLVKKSFLHHSLHIGKHSRTVEDILAGTTANLDPSLTGLQGPRHACVPPLSESGRFGNSWNEPHTPTCIPSIIFLQTKNSLDCTADRAVHVSPSPEQCIRDFRKERGRTHRGMKIVKDE